MMDIVTCYVATETFVGVILQDLAFAVSLILESLVGNKKDKSNRDILQQIFNRGCFCIVSGVV